MTTYTVVGYYDETRETYVDRVDAVDVAAAILEADRRMDCGGTIIAVFAGEVGRALVATTRNADRVLEQGEEVWETYNAPERRCALDAVEDGRDVVDAVDEFRQWRSSEGRRAASAEHFENGRP